MTGSGSNSKGVSLGVRIRVSFREEPSLVLSGEETKCLGCREVLGKVLGRNKTVKTLVEATSDCLLRTIHEVKEFWADWSRYFSSSKSSCRPTFD